MVQPLVLLAVRHVDAFMLRKAFSPRLGKEVANLGIQDDFGWSWFRAPAGLSLDAISELRAMRRAAICVVSGRDGWKLELLSRDNPPLVFEQAYPKQGGPPPSVDMARWEAAFLAAEIPFDAVKVEQALTGESMTPAEWDDPLGNLPRFLVGLGLRGEWARRIALPPPPFQFTMGLMFALMVVGAFLLATIRVNPLLGLLLTAVVGPACVRLTQRVGATGAQTSGEQVSLLIQSCVVMVVVLAALTVTYVGSVLVLAYVFELLRPSTPWNSGYARNIQFAAFFALFPAAAATVYTVLKLW